MSVSARVFCDGCGLIGMTIMITETDLPAVITKIITEVCATRSELGQKSGWLINVDGKDYCDKCKDPHGRREP